MIFFCLIKDIINGREIQNKKSHNLLLLDNNNDLYESYQVKFLFLNVIFITIKEM